MTLLRITMLIEVDDEALAEHDGNASAPPNDPKEWYGGDVQAAFDQAIAEPVHDELESVEEVAEEDG